MVNETQPVDSTYKVRLVSVLNPSDTVVFDVTPSFSEQRQVDYTPVIPVHMPGAIQVYKHTNSRTFSIGAHLVSRNSQQATLNMFYLQMLRSWTMPFFGINSATSSRGVTNQRNVIHQTKTTTNQSDAFQFSSNTTPLTDEQKTKLAQQQVQGGFADNQELLGAPPEVLYLYAYSSAHQSERRTGLVNINKIPVVMTSLDITYPEDVDYLPTNWNNEPFPIKMDVAISLAETHSPIEYEQFSLQQYKAGQLKRF